MGAKILLIVALTAAAAVFALMWRRMNALAQEVRLLRAALKQAGAEGLALPDLEAAFADSEPDTDAPKPIFIDRAPGAAPFTLPSWPHEYWALFAVGFLAPFVLLAFKYDGLSLGFALVAFGAALYFSSQTNSVGLAWIGASAATVWALITLSTGAAQALPVSTPAVIALLGVLGFAHAALDADWRPGALLSAAMLAVLSAMAIHSGVIGPAGCAAAILAGLGAALGASHPRLDGLQFIGFIGAGLLLFFLSDQDHAGIWFTPAVAWTGAGFLGLTAARAPILGRQGALTAATGCVAPLFALSALYASDHGLVEPLMAAAAFAGLAILIAAILTLSVRSAGTLSDLAFTGWVLGAGAFAAATAAFLLALPLAYAGAGFAALALGLILLHRHANDNLLLCGAAIAAGFAFACALAALVAFNGSADMLTLLAFASIGMLLPGIILGAAAYFLRQSPVTRMALELGAGACGLFFISALLRMLFSAGSPSPSPIGLAELGAHALVWAILAIGLLRFGSSGAREARIAAASVLVCAGGAVALAALALWLAGVWGPPPVLATTLRQHAPIGFLLMAIGAWLHWVYWRGQNFASRALAAFAAACTLSAAWISLEFSWLHQPTSEDFDWETVGLTIALFVLAFGLIGLQYVQRARYQGRSHLHKNLKRHGRGH